MSMTDREKAARAIGYLEGMSATIWVSVGEKLIEEYADYYDKQVEVLRKELFGDGDGK